MRSAIRPLAILVLAGAALALARPNGPALIAVRVELPSTVVDGERIVARVTVTNSADRELSVAVPAPGVTLFSRITPLEDFGSGKCHGRVVRDARQSGSAMTLAPRGSARAEVDLLSEYPFGLPPGRYRVVIEYRQGNVRAASAPLDLRIDPADSPAYRSFLEICRQFRSGADATVPTVAFVKSHPTFPFTDALLDFARGRAKGMTRMELNRLILERTASPESVERAERDVDDMAGRSQDLAEYAAYIERLRASMNDPANGPVVREYRQLGTILAPGDFAAHQQFLREHSRSFLAPDVIHAIIAAIEQGVLPPGARPADADRLLVEYYGALLREDERNYFVQKAKRDPAVAALLRRGARE